MAVFVSKDLLVGCFVSFCGIVCVGELLETIVFLLTKLLVGVCRGVVKTHLIEQLVQAHSWSIVIVPFLHVCLRGTHEVRVWTKKKG